MRNSDASRGRQLRRVAVVLASRNGASFIREQILSILWQEKCDCIVHVRDDGSTDGTVEEVRALAREYPGRVIEVEDGLGPSGSAAQNFFLALLALDDAEFDYVALSDQDDIWDARKISRAIEQMCYSGSSGYSSNLVAFSTSPKPPMLIRKDQPEVDLDYMFQTASAGCTYVITSELCAKVRSKLAANSPNPDIAHDILIYAIARSHGFRWYRDSEAHILYRQHDRNLVGSRAGWRGIADRVSLVRGGWYRNQITQLEPYISGSPAERKVLAAVSRRSIRDRLWLASSSSRFRRRAADAAAFSIAQFFT